MISIYIHIPFCERKCFYCDFYSVENLSSTGSYIDALKKEISISFKNIKEMQSDTLVQTIYFGGGTPSIISPDFIGEIIENIGKTFGIYNQAEITIEGNPGSISDESLKKYKACGINRISLGVQSFIQRELDFLERIHTVEEAKKAIEIVKNNGFDNMSIDLIYAIPSGQLIDWEYSLNTALTFQPQHISAYSLIYEEGTRLYVETKRNKILPVSEDVEADMYLFAMEFLQKNGYFHYEVSNYAKSGCESKHNMNYWNFSEYLGFGPSAHSYFNNTRWWNHRDLSKYITDLNKNQLPIESKEDITLDMHIEEIILLGLRSTGIDLKKFKEEFNIDFYKKNVNIVGNFLSDGYMRLENDKLILTNKGFLICDEICKLLI